MANYFIYVCNGADTLSFPISGTEAAWNAYRKACNLVELFDGSCDLVDADTAEVIESFGCEEMEDDFWIETTETENERDPNYDEEWDFEDDFDPYLGCWTGEC